MTNKIDETVEIPNVNYPDSGTRREAIADGWWWVIISKGHNAEPMRKHLGEIWGGCGHYQDYDFFKQFPLAQFLAPIPPPASLAAMREAMDALRETQQLLKMCGDSWYQSVTPELADKIEQLEVKVDGVLSPLIDSALSTTPPASLAAKDEEIARLKIALADAIRRPMGVIPDSAAGLISIDEMDEAEKRMVAK